MTHLVIKLRFIGLLTLLSIILLAPACSRANDPNDGVQNEQPTATDDIPIPTLSPEPTPPPSPTPEPTPLSPVVVINDQVLDESGVLVADQVSIPGPGWLAIYRTVEGEPDEIIGRQPLAAGLHDRVEVTVDTAAATELLVAGLHMDVGAEGVFEFPGEDQTYPGEPEADFTVELQLPHSQIEAAEQAVAEDGVITLTRVELLETSWVLIHADVDGDIGPVIGGILLEPGVYENFPLTIDWRRATPTLYAVLHEDDPEPGILDYPNGDMPILNRGEPIVAAFRATYPPEVMVLDQPVIDGAITIERAISNGDGWVAIYNEVDGQPGLIIGTAPLEDGLNELVVVDLLQSGITSQLFARLHEDTEPEDAFNFPGQDPPVLFNNRLPTAAAFRTDIGAHAFVHDQRLGEDGTVSVAVLVSPVDAWAAVYSDNDGQPGDLLGQTWAPAGITRDIVVDVGESVDTGVLHLIFYQDLGTPEEFDVPGDDPALTNDDNRPIRIPFELTPSVTN